MMSATGRAAIRALVVSVVLLAAAQAGAAAPFKVDLHLADGNDQEWQGRPSDLGGVSTYNNGEFIHSDFLLDDYGANVDTVEGSEGDPPSPITGVYPNPQDPTHPINGSTANNNYTRFRHSGDYGYPARSAAQSLSFDNVADVVEFRMATTPDQLHFLVRLAALKTAGDAIIGIGIDADRNKLTGAGAWPRGANLPQQLGYDYFITFWGTGGELVDYTGATPVATAITVAANTERNFLEASLPRLQGLGSKVWRVYVGAGLNDGSGNWAMVQPTNTRSQAPGALGVYPNIFNILFRQEPVSLYRDRGQANDLAQRDISLAFADIDLAKLDAGVSDPVPKPTGLQNPHYDSLALADGEGVDGILGAIGSTNFIYKAAKQPFMMYLPTDYYSNPEPARMMMWYHCLNCNHNVWPVGVASSAVGGNNNYGDPAFGTEHTQPLIDDLHLLMGGAMQGGESGINSGTAPQATGAASYGGWPQEERLLRDIETTMRTRFGLRWDENRKIYAGMSMGGSTTKKMASLYPDELTAALAHSSPGLPTIPENVRNLFYIQVTGDTGLDSTAATAGRQSAETLTGLGYEHFYMEYLVRAHDFNLVWENWPITAGLLRNRKRDPNPARVTYTFLAANEVPALGLIHDRAYWATELKLAEGAASGTIDAFALPMANKLPTKASRLTGTFVNATTANNAYVSWLEYRDLSGHGLADYLAGWAPSPDVRVVDVPVSLPPNAGSNGFSMTTKGLAGSTLDMARMGIKTTQPITGTQVSDQPHQLKLRGHWPADTMTAIDGKTVAAALTASDLTVTMPAGTHVLTIVGMNAASPGVILPVVSGGSAAAGAGGGRFGGAVVVSLLWPLLLLWACRRRMLST